MGAASFCLKLVLGKTPRTRAQFRSSFRSLHVNVPLRPQPVGHSSTTKLLALERVQKASASSPREKI